MSLQHTENLELKRKIAQKALEFVKEGDKIILDSGSTITEIAKTLMASRKALTIITNALNIALIAGSMPSMEVHVTGGEFKAPTLSLTGQTAAGFFSSVHVDTLFLATGGISNSFDITYPGFNDLPVKQAMIAAAKTTILAADSTKIGKTAFASLGSISMVDILLTDDRIEAATIKELEALGVSVVVC